MYEAEPYKKDPMIEAEPYEPASAPEPAELSVQTAVIINEAETINTPKAKSSLEGVASTIYSILLIGFATTVRGTQNTDVLLVQFLHSSFCWIRVQDLHKKTLCLCERH
jgi:hypothetical protein